MPQRPTLIVNPVTVLNGIQRYDSGVVGTKTPSTGAGDEGTVRVQ